MLSYLTRRFELPVLLLIAAGSSAIWAFIEIAEEVREGGTREFDEALLRALRSPGEARGGGLLARRALVSAARRRRAA